MMPNDEEIGNAQAAECDHTHSQPKCCSSTLVQQQKQVNDKRQFRMHSHNKNSPAHH